MPEDDAPWRTSSFLREDSKGPANFAPTGTGFAGAAGTTWPEQEAISQWWVNVRLDLFNVASLARKKSDEKLRAVSGELDAVLKELGKLKTENEKLRNELLAVSCREIVKDLEEKKEEAVAREDPGPAEEAVHRELGELMVTVLGKGLRAARAREQR